MISRMVNITRPLNKALQYTLAIIKPDVSTNSAVRESLLSIVEGEGFKIIRLKKTWLSLDMAKCFYREHKNKFFFNRLVTFMSSSPIYVAILCKEDAISCWRSLIGPTSVYKSLYYNPDCLRARFGLTDTRNAIHGSSSHEAVLKEVEFFFPNIRLDTLDSDICRGDV